MGQAVSAVIAVSASLACRAAPIPSSERWPAGTPWRARDVVVQGSRLRVIDSGTGPALVFVHGLAASMFTWRKVLGPILAAGYRVVAFDNRGFGFSDKPATGYGNGDYVQLLDGLLETLHLEQVVLVGHSMGGQIAAEMALAHPDRVRGLVLVGSSGSGLDRAWLLRLAGWPLFGRLQLLHGRAATGRLLRFTYGDPSRVTEQDVDQYYAPLAEPGAVRALHTVIREFRFDALRGQWRALAAPTLLLWGDRDRVVPLTVGREVALELPRGVLEVFSGAGHNLPEERSGAVAEVVLAFLRQGLPHVPGDMARAMSGDSHFSLLY